MMVQVEGAKKKKLEVCSNIPGIQCQFDELTLDDIDNPNNIERYLEYKSFSQLGALGCVIQANGRLAFENDLRSGGLLHLTTQ